MARRALFPSLLLAAGSYSAYKSGWQPSKLELFQKSQVGFSSQPIYKSKPSKTCYSPLDVTKNQIRVLLLHPGSGSDEIRCDLRVESLDEEPLYTALSYTWGEPLGRSQSLWSFRGIFQHYRALFRKHLLELDILVTLPYARGEPLNRSHPLYIFRELRHYFWAAFRKLLLFLEIPKQKALQLNGVPFPITRNLAAALKSLRHAEETLPLWVDAVCIDQDDAIEKGNQITKMGDIYAHAQRTYVWLGPEADDSDVAMKFIQSADAIDIEDPKISLDDLTIPWPALQALFARSWWSRIWIIQEVFMSKRVVVKCGSEEVEMAKLVNLAKKETRLRTLVLDGRNRGLQAHARWTFIPPGNPFYTVFLFWEQQQKILRATEPNKRWDWIYHIPLTKSPEAWKKWQESMAVVNQLNLWDWLYVTQPFTSTVPRDRIYGILGLAKMEAREAIPIDYSDENDDQKTFIQVAQHVLRSSKNLQMLQIAQNHTASLNLPSWVPDFSFSGNAGIDMIGRNYKADGGFDVWKRLTPAKVFEEHYYPEKPTQVATWFGVQCLWFLPLHIIIYSIKGHVRTPYHLLFIASTGTLGYKKFQKRSRIIYETNPEFSEDRKSLSLDGLVFDSVAFVDPAPDFKVFKDTDSAWIERWGHEITLSLIRLRRVSKKWMAIVESCEANPYESLRGGRYEAFWRTLVADRIRNGTGFYSPPSSFRNAYKHYMSRIDALATVDGNVATHLYCTAAMKAFYRKAFIMTKEGYMGIAPEQTREGDLICILRKGDVPFVLRLVDERYYELIGDCFVHGIMDGSFARQVRPEDVQEFLIK